MKGWQDDKDVWRPMAARHHREEHQDDDVCEPGLHQYVELYLTCCVCDYTHRFVFLVH